MNIKHIHSDVQRLGKIFNIIQDKYYNGVWNNNGMQCFITSPRPNSRFRLFDLAFKEAELVELGKMIDICSKYPHLLIEMYEGIENGRPYNVIISPIRFIGETGASNGVARLNGLNYTSYLVE